VFYPLSFFEWKIYSRSHTHTHTHTHTRTHLLAIFALPIVLSFLPEIRYVCKYINLPVQVNPSPVYPDWQVHI